MKTGKQDPNTEKLPDCDLSEQTEREKPSRAETAFTILSYFFFGIAVVSFLTALYVYTAKDLTVSPFLSPFLSLSFGGGIGLGMLFRTIRNKKENISPINYVSKICVSILVLLLVLLSFLSGMLTVLRF